MMVRQTRRAVLYPTTTGLPWVRLKMAASIDGFTALPNGSSQWITDAAAKGLADPKKVLAEFRAEIVRLDLKFLDRIRRSLHDLI